ncbi:hypothetical protein CDD82_3648 [Ophiocordyceps australis]|uniref:Uncharacterized protein n=1 Tax=Ophiocordyceps australis TaxID=1399860 RepID=A0A2C5Z7Z8_9HYPO|nr:hypothetical protein CDD82_3648 [Ophiocordyceps australis]
MHSTPKVLKGLVSVLSDISICAAQSGAMPFTHTREQFQVFVSAELEMEARIKPCSAPCSKPVYALETHMAPSCWAILLVFWCTLTACQPHSKVGLPWSRCVDIVCVSGTPSTCAAVWQVSPLGLELHGYIQQGYMDQVYQSVCPQQHLESDAGSLLTKAIGANARLRGLGYPTSPGTGRNGYYIVAGPRIQSRRSEIRVKGPGTVYSPRGRLVVGSNQWVSVVLMDTLHPKWLAGGVVRAFSVSARGAVRVGKIAWPLDPVKATTFEPDGEPNAGPLCVFIPPVRYWGCSAKGQRVAVPSVVPLLPTSQRPSTQPPFNSTVKGSATNLDVIPRTHGNRHYMACLDPNHPDHMGGDVFAGMEYAKNRWRTVPRNRPLDDRGSSSVPKWKAVGTISSQKEPDMGVGGDMTPMNGEKIGTRPETPMDWSANKPSTRGGYGRDSKQRPSSRAFF